MAFYDFIDVTRVDKAVPSALRVDHRNRSTGASVKTTRLIDTNLARARQAQLFDARFAMVKCRLCTLKRATGLTIFSFVETEKNVVFVIRGACPIA
jgi:hypothetical protein